VLCKILEHARTTIGDPYLAVLHTEIAANMFADWGRQGAAHPPVRLLEIAMSLAKGAVDDLRSFRNVRPSRIQPALVRALEACAEGYCLSRSDLKAIHAVAGAINI
jgi:hypothetical protein